MKVGQLFCEAIESMCYMQKIVGFVVVVSAAVLLGAHLEITKTLADSTELSPVQVTARTAVAETAIATSSLPVAATSTLPATLETTQQTTTPKAKVSPEPKIVPTPAAAVQATKEKTFTAQVDSKKPTIGTPDQYPVRLIIPSINLNAPIEPVGVNAKGEMDVPSGSTNDIGWYKGGPMPGSYGSAVLDAHVFAALKDLRYVKVGDPVYVLTKGGTRLRFVVKESTVFTLSEITSDILFGRSGGKWLNIITCAGTYIASQGTYDHRLVDFALFEEEELD